MFSNLPSAKTHIGSEDISTNAVGLIKHVEILLASDIKIVFLFMLHTRFRHVQFLGHLLNYISEKLVNF